MLKRTSGLVALAGCLVAVGCGGDDEGNPIPANIADQLETRLDEVDRRFKVGGGACADIEDDSRPAVNQLVASVPQKVDADVRRALREGFDRLFALTAEQCDEERTQTQAEPAPAPEPTPAPEPEPTPPETTETEPPPETTETEPPPEQTQPEQPPEQGQGGDAPGGGQGGSGGGGQGGEGQTGQGGQGGGQGPLGGQGGGALVPEDQG